MIINYMYLVVDIDKYFLLKFIYLSYVYDYLIVDICVYFF